MQDEDGDSTATPTVSGEKCFCAKEDRCPTIGEDGESDDQRPNKVCVYIYICLFMCYLHYVCQGKKSVSSLKESDSSRDSVGREVAKVCGVLVQWY